jgi:hypothetical protein
VTKQWAQPSAWEVGTMTMLGSLYAALGLSRKTDEWSPDLLDEIKQRDHFAFPLGRVEVTDLICQPQSFLPSIQASRRARGRA